MTRKRHQQGKQAKIETYHTPKKAYMPIGEPIFEIAAWCSDDDAKEPPEQVHLLVHWPVNFGDNLNLPPMALRFKSPDTLGDIIEQLIEYRRIVWPDADLINGETK